MPTQGQSKPDSGTRQAADHVAGARQQMPPFQWEDIDHGLVSLRLAELAEDMNQKVKGDEARIQFKIDTI